MGVVSKRPLDQLLDSATGTLMIGLLLVVVAIVIAVVDSDAPAVWATLLMMGVVLSVGGEIQRRFVLRRIQRLRGPLADERPEGQRGRADDLAAKWRRLAVANTLGAAVVIAAMWSLAPVLLASVVTVVMVIAVGDIWFLARRTRRTGNPFLRVAPKSDAG